MVKTVILDGSELMVSGPDGDNAEIHNFGTDMIYASKFPNISANADNVIAVSAGAIDGLTGTGGKVYLLGKGKVQVNFTDEKITRTSVSYASGSGSGVLREYVDEKDADTLAAAKEYADMLNSDLSGYVGYTESDIYGLEADFENCVFTRLAGAVGKNPGADFDCVRAYGGRRRCNLSDSGEVLAYYGDEGFKADGSNGQVMVEQPRFYYKVVPLKVEKIEGADGYHLRKARYYISDTPKAGFKVHPAFVRDGGEAERIYLSAFEGSVMDEQTGEYLLDDPQTVSFNRDKLSSICGAMPASGSEQALTRDNLQSLAKNRGTGWEITTIHALAATQLLFIIEYASFNSQSAVGPGIVNASGPTRTGSTLPLGNASGSAANGGVSYRGEENLWGNSYCFINGVIADNPSETGYVSRLYISNSTDDIKSSFLYNKTQNMYPSALGYIPGYDWLFWDSEHNGNTTYLTGDIVWNGHAGKRYLMQGGRWTNESNAGLFSYSFLYKPDGHSNAVGARAIYIP